MLKAFIDRIEDAKTAVVIVERIGQLTIPVKKFPFKIHDGMHLTINMVPNPQSEKTTQDAIQLLREKLLKRSARKI